MLWKFIGRSGRAWSPTYFHTFYQILPPQVNKLNTKDSWDLVASNLSPNKDSMALRQLNFIKKDIFFFIPQAYTSTNSDGTPLSLLHDYFSLHLITARTLTDDITLSKFYVLVLLFKHLCAATPLSIAVWKKNRLLCKIKRGSHNTD